MKRTLLAAFAAALLFGTGLAAEQEPLVDIATAEAEIAQLDKDIADLKAENDKLAAEIKDTQAAIDGSQAELADLASLLDSSRLQLNEVRDFRASIRDAKLLAKTDDAIARLTKAIATASERRNVINAENVARVAKIKAAREKSDYNANNVNRKTDRKTALQASIARTKAQDALFNARMQQIDAFLNKSATK